MIIRYYITLACLLWLHLPASARLSSKSSKSSKSRKTSTKNIIILVPDGCDETIQTVARWYKQGGNLQLDELPSCSVKNHMANSVMSDSAAAATAFASGKKTTVDFLSVGPRTEDLLSIYNTTEMAEPYAPLATVLEAAKSVHMSTGLVATSSVTHATPAAFGCHVDHRHKMEDIMEHLVYNNIDVVMGGGKKYLLPAGSCPNAVAGGARTDCQNLSSVLEERGYQMIETRNDLESLDYDKIWGMFATEHLSPEGDRPPWEPSLAEMTEKAVEVLSKNDKGFLLVVEGSQIDWGAHNNDPFYMLHDFIAFDDAVKVAVDFAKDNDDTVVLAFPDHNTGGMKIGNYLHGFKDVSVEALVDPLRGMKTTANKLISTLPPNPTSQDIIDAVKTNWGLDITEDDASAIMNYKTESGRNLSFSLGRILTERYTYLTFSTHEHNGETVPLWMYGKDVPTHVIDNTDIAFMVADMIDADLDELTQEIFVDLNTTGLEYVIDTNNGVVQVGDATIPIGKDLLQRNGEEIQLPGVTVYAPATDKVYISAKAIQLLDEV